MRVFSGARATRVVDRSHSMVACHSHEWPVLSIFVLGSYNSRTEMGEAEISQPSFVIYRARQPHENIVGPRGFEQVEIEFDPRWLGWNVPDVPVTRRIGGRLCPVARQLACSWQRPLGEDVLRERTRSFLESIRPADDPVHPNWIGALGRPGSGAARSLRSLAGELGRDPGWMGAVYHRCMGERVSEAATRGRLEVAACLLRETNDPPASIAAAAGFFDQSHMVRACKRHLGRLPSEVRADAESLRGPGVSVAPRP